METPGLGADDTHRALGIGGSDACRIAPSVLGEAVEQHETGNAGAIQDAGDVMAFMCEIFPGEPAARNDQHGGSVWLGRRKGGHARPRDAFHAPAAIVRTCPSLSS